MGIRKLSSRKGTPSVSLDKGDLQVDGLLDENGAVPDDQHMHVQRLGNGGYLVRAVQDGEIPEVDELLPVEGR